MIELKNWIEKNKFADKPWLVLGKGPTFAKIHDVDLEQYNTFALNHVVREQKVGVAHIIDIDVVEAIGNSLIENCTWLIMPRTPHVKCFASEYFRLEDWINCIPTLCEAEKQGKLITYSFSHERRNDDPWTIVCRYFSSEAALGILGRMGSKKVRSLGIDGGKNYSKTFADLKDTLLVNSQPSFDLQFDELEKIAAQFNMDYAPLFQVKQKAESARWQQGEDSAAGGNRTSALNPAVPPSQTSLNSDTISNTIGFLAESSEEDKSPLPLQKSSLTTLTTAARVQVLECDYRAMRAELFSTREELAKTSKDLGITSDRLGWARDEIAEYRTRVLELENNIHRLYKSLSWKIGRFVTKPAEAISKRFNPASSPFKSVPENAPCTKLAED